MVSYVPIESAAVVSRVWTKVVVVLLLCLLPLLASPVIPLIDFYAHALRYDILADAGRDASYAENYQVAWKFVPNLGFDVIGTALFSFMPPLIASRVLLMIVIAAPVAGVLVLSWCLHGRVNAINAALAGIVAHNFVLGWGFSNFLLGFGLALAGLGFWIAYAQSPRRQFFVALLFALLIFFTHGFVFAIWGLMLCGVEVMAASGVGRRRAVDLMRRSLRLLAVGALPTLLFLATATANGSKGVTDVISKFAVYDQKGGLAARLLQEVWVRLDAGLRVAESNWPVADRLFGLTLWGLIAYGLWTGRLQIDRRLRGVVLLLAILVVIVPPVLFGVGHLSERLPFCLLAVVAASLRASPLRRKDTALVPALILLFPLHILMVTLGWSQERQNYARFLSLAETLPVNGLATVAYAPGARPRDEMRSCKPLTFLLAMTRGISVPTFSNPTEQPLAIIGPLQAAMKDYEAREAESGASLAGAAQVRAMLDAGYGMVVLCEGRFVGAGDGTPRSAHPVEGAEVLGAGSGWTLYRALPH